MHKKEERAGLKEELDEERKKVFVDHFDLTVREVVRMATEENHEGDRELNISPTYQRKFRWSEPDESKLIESIFLELPVPPIFVAGNKDGTWEIVDGLQRVSTLIHFMKHKEEDLSIINKEEPLRLKKLDRLPSFNLKRYKELPKPIQFDFRKRYLRITVLSDKSDRQVRYDLFERLNKQGIALTPQEIRSCIYRGGLIDFVSDLSSITEFENLLKLQRGNKNDGTKEELVLKFFAFKNDRENYSGNVKISLMNIQRRIEKMKIYTKREMYLNKQLENSTK
jgi:uncharacterized protein with ParB-like and HNH nuclease domain